MKNQQVIGWRERIDLPDWGICGLPAKSDTSANSSAIDVAWIKELPGNQVRFGVRLSRKNMEQVKEIEADILRNTRVRSRNRARIERIIVETNIQMGPILKPIEFDHVCGKDMLCRALLGGTTVEGDFLIDCSARHLHTHTPDRVTPAPGEPDHYARIFFSFQN